MTQPDTTPLPPETVGTNPRNADEVNGLTGLHLRNFLAVRVAIAQDQSFMAATDLTAAPYFFTADQQTQIKTAISGLNTSLEAVDLTFISRIVGMA